MYNVNDKLELCSRH